MEAAKLEFAKATTYDYRQVDFIVAAERLYSAIINFSELLKPRFLSAFFQFRL